MKKYILLLTVFCVIHSLNAQELIRPLYYNPVIKNYLSSNNNNAMRFQAAGVMLHLPFTDDFSIPGIYPSSEKWMDNKVFINSQLPRVLPTVGAATFDGLNELGNPYIPGTASSGTADVLTSTPLFLYTKPQGGLYSLSDSIAVNFYYQKKGYGDAPEAGDSLVLEFYNPSMLTWSRVWHAPGGVASGQDTVFTKTVVYITDSAYLQDGFQFRLRNYGNLSGALDHWHVDYISVYATTSGSSDIDQAFVNDRISALETFTSIPWKHYKAYANQGDLLKDNSSVDYIIYHNQPVVNAGFNHRAYSYDGDVVGLFGTGSSLFPVSSNQRLSFSYPINYTFPNAEEVNDEYSFFDLVDYFSTQQGGDNIYTNDTIYHRQIFSNYYSYDDGTCEVAYDLVNAANGKVAMRFDMLQADTLRGVQIFFAQQNGVVSNKLITIKVWSSLSPETVIYQLPNQTPAYVDSINGFATYLFTAPVPATGFYIGFQQVSPDGLHLGFDRNTANNSKMFYNTSGIWSQVSVVPGSFMMRPLTGSVITSSIDESSPANISINCYPNPGNGILYIEHSGRRDMYNRLEVSDVAGRKVYKEAYKEGITDLSFLSKGIYFIRLSNDQFISTPVQVIIR